MPDHAPETMRAFAIDFFSAFGAQIEHRSGGELTVHLTPELAEHFGKPSLHLTFRAVELSPFEDLVVYGSRVFDQMVAWLENRGAYTALRLPARLSGPADRAALPPTLALHNVTADVHSESRLETCILFNLRLTYTADDRRDELLTLALDEQGKPRPELAQAYHDAVEQANAPALPSETVDLLAERAIELARSHARQRSAEIEREQRPRVERTLERLKSFYEGRSAEIDAGEGEEDETRRAEAAALKAFLAEELERKLADEIARHHVQATITSVNWATLTIPFWRYELTLRRPNGLSRALTLDHNLHSGALSPLLCHCCEKPISTLALCDHDHLACPDCLHTCAVCGRDLCDACGIVRDPIGGEWICADCAVRCDACGQAFIPAHTAPCAHCGRPHCQRDLRTCPVCNKQFCTAHVIKCRVCGALRCQNDARTCGSRTRDTGQHSVCEQHHALCPICGQGMCPEHTVTCALCHQAVCSSCADTHGTCRTCVETLHSDPTTWADLPPEASGWQWRVAQNKHWRVYYGEKKIGPVVQWRIIATDLDHRVLYTYVQPWPDSMLAWLRRQPPPSGWPTR